MEPSAKRIEKSDYISDLPDNILHHILSFLPIKNIIHTTLISKRYTNLWTSVPVLDFDGLVFSPKPKFTTFVNSVLHRRDNNNSGIYKFSVRFSGDYCKFSDVNPWIESAVNHNVNDLSVCFYWDDVYVCFDLPKCVFTCRSLRVLKLNLNYSSLEIPDSVSLPLLTTLELSSVMFAYDDGDALSVFFSKCPLLENVRIEDCLLRGPRIFHISSASLEKLVIDGLPKNKKMYSGSSGRELRITAPKLMSFEYKERNTRNISLQNMSSLTNAIIGFNYKSGSQRRESHAINLLKSLANVKALTLSKASIKFLSSSSFSLRGLPKFSNLKQLKLSVEVTNKSIVIVACFLHISPSLENLLINLSHRRHLVDDNGVFDPQDLECQVDHLKTVVISGFIGGKQELMLVKYLLGHSFTLEKMTIVCSNALSANSERQMKIKEDLLLHPRSSVNSEIIFQSI